MSAVRDIMICGDGLAGQMCAAALAHTLPDDIMITIVGHDGSNAADIFYGSVTAPTSYKFLLACGVSEPEMLQTTDSTFSLGTHMQDWGPEKRDWVQCFHIPLPVMGGVAFHHYVVRAYQEGHAAPTLEPFTMSVKAARDGVFAHPPEGQSIPLSSVDYGFHFDTAQWRDFFKSRAQARVRHITANIAAIEAQDDTIRALITDTGERLEANLFINTNPISASKNGSQATGLLGLGTARSTERRLRASVRDTTAKALEGVTRTLRGTDFGWESTTPLRGRDRHMRVEAADALAPQDAVTATLAIGRNEAGWVGNCVGIGHAVAGIEPLSPAPMMMLQADIERLLELIPVTTDMAVERREYNRLFLRAFGHIDLFHRALFESDAPTPNTYWEAARAVPADPLTAEQLSAKLSQFESRGVCVQYDYEPFNAEEWTQQHFGMGRVPRRYDPMADRMPSAHIDQMLSRMILAIGKMAEKMPPHHQYMMGFLNYLKDRHGPA